MPRYRITISSQSGQAMTDLVRKHKIQVLDHGARRSKEAGFVVHAIVEEADIKRLQDAGYTVERHEDVDENGKARQREVGQGNRYKKDQPRGVSMPYLNVNEVESALTVATSALYTPFTQLIPLPNLTWEGRQCNAIKIANGNDPRRPGVYFLGGIHSGEWGSSDILINFIWQLEQAYLNGTGITLGGKTFSASDIKTIVDNLDIYVFPQANPDGRNYSMKPGNDSMWRKNRRTAAPNSNSGDCVGVDLNRNFDFLWDFQTLFAPSTVSCSADPCDYEYYHGPSAFSEPETRNVKWIHDNFPNIGYFVDLHSAGPCILYSWGDDDNQETDPRMNFQNPAYNNVRGIPDVSGQTGHEAYREYIPADDFCPRVDLANAFAAGIQAVRGTSYCVEQSVRFYPTAGASDDYSYSRHIVDGSKRNVMAYTLEWGTKTQPCPREMQNIIQEITSGLLAFCLWVR